MNYVYNDLLHSIELTKQYLLDNNISYSLKDNFQNGDLEILEIFNKLDAIKKGFYSSNGDITKLNKYVSDFISIKYSPSYLAMVNSIRNNKEVMTLRKVSSR